MAIFHSHIQIISRGKGKSAVAAAAYRAGENITNEYDGITHDYTRKGGIVHSEILLPEHVPFEYFNRSILWNAVEKIEKANNSQLAREIDIALPVELTQEQNISLLRRYVNDTFVSAGMCADICMHDTGKGNPHAHIMLTLRPIEPNGKWGSKQKKEYIFDSDGNKIYDPIKRQYKCRSIPSTNWNDRANADIWRAAWEEATNTELERLGFSSRIDRRTYEEQGIEKIPTVHMGVAAMQMEKRGIRTERGDINRTIEITNKEISQLRARINHLEKWVEEEATNLQRPTLSDVISEILSHKEQSSLTRLKNATDIFTFLHRNEIYGMEDLEKKVATMRGKVQSINTDMKKINRRISTLKEHLEHSENFKKYRKTKSRYDELYSVYEVARKTKGFGSERKAQKALDAANEYYEENRPQLAMFDNADKYLRDVLQERFDPKKLPPMTKWREELITKTSEQESMYREYVALKDETAKVEKIRRSVGEIMQAEIQEQKQQNRVNGIDL